MHIWMDLEDTISSNTPRLPLASAQATAVWCFPSRKAWWFGDNWAWVWIPPGSSTGLTWLNYLHLLGLCSLRWRKGQWFSLHLVTWGLNEITWNEGFEHCLDKINTKKKKCYYDFSPPIHVSLLLQNRALSRGLFLHLQSASPWPLLLSSHLFFHISDLLASPLKEHLWLCWAHLDHLPTPRALTNSHTPSLFY